MTPISICSKMTFQELKYLIGIIDEQTHPNLIFWLLHQCRQHVAMGTRWSELGMYDFEFTVLGMRCQQNQVIREIKRVLAKNQHTPLDHHAAATLERLLDESDHCHLDWSRAPVSRSAIWTMIDLANAGYQHLRKETAA